MKREKKKKGKERIWRRRHHRPWGTRWRPFLLPRPRRLVESAGALLRPCCPSWGGWAPSVPVSPPASPSRAGEPFPRSGRRRRQPRRGDAAWRARLPQTHLLPSIRLPREGGPGNWEGESGGGTRRRGVGSFGVPLAMCLPAWPPRPGVMWSPHAAPRVCPSWDGQPGPRQGRRWHRSPPRLFTFDFLP